MIPLAGDRLARAELTYVAEPADALLADLLRVLAPADVTAAIRSGAIPAGVTMDLAPYRAAALRPALARWRARIPGNTPDVVSRYAATGIQLVCPGDPGWPSQLDDLGATRPYALWVRGTTDLQTSCSRSIAVTGARCRYRIWDACRY